MPSQLDFSKTIGGFQNNVGTIQSAAVSFIPVRVTEVNILPTKNNRSLFKLAEEYWGVGAIRFNLLNQTSKLRNIPNGSIAFPINANIRTLPLVNEIVYVVSGPAKERIKEGQTRKPNANAFYYTNALPIWNSTEQNALPALVTLGNTTTDTNTLAEVEAGLSNNENNPKEGPKLGEVFRDSGKIKNLYPQEGDIILEGRFGNSLRFSSTGRITGSFEDFDVEPKNPWSNAGSVGDPITILRNGQKAEGIEFDVWQPIFEDVNTDDSSIYLTSTQKIPLEIAFPNLKSYGIDITPPEETTAEFEKEGKELGNEFTSNKDSDSINTPTDSVNREPVLGVNDITSRGAQTLETQGPTSRGLEGGANNITSRGAQTLETQGPTSGGNITKRENIIVKGNKFELAGSGRIDLRTVSTDTGKVLVAVKKEGNTEITPLRSLYLQARAELESKYSGRNLNIPSFNQLD